MMSVHQLRQRFNSSIRRGTGEAWIIREGHPDLDVTDYVIAACLTHQAYDPQSEGSRAEYLFRLLKTDLNRDDIANAILTKLSSRDPIDTWDLDQMMDLAVLLHRDGNPDARNVLLQRYQAAPTTETEPWGDEQIIDLDGLNGLILVAQTRGNHILNSGGWADDAALKYFEERHPGTDAEGLLKGLAIDDAGIRAWLDSINENRVNRPMAREPLRETYDSAMAKIASERYYFSKGIRADELQDDEFMKLADDAMKESNPARLMGFFNFFSRRRFPLDFSFILDRIDKLDDGRQRMIEAGVAAMALFTDERIREFALGKLTKSISPAVYLPLLSRNYAKGDAALLAEILRGHGPEQGLHHFATGVIEIYRSNDDPDAGPLLLALYDMLNCGDCRGKIVEWLLRQDAMPADRVDELWFDSCEKVRLLAERFGNRVGGNGVE